MATDGAGSLRFLETANKCLSDAAPPCARACPLGVDVRGVAEKLRLGLVSAAYKLFARDAVFPGIVSSICDMPCTGVCARTEIDEAVAINAVERFCYRESLKKDPTPFFIRKKDKRMCVIGAGPTGLACAARLTGRGYAVTLIEKTERLGGRLLCIPESELPAETLARDLKPLSESAYLDLRLRTDVADVDPASFDAVLVAVGDARVSVKEAPCVFFDVNDPLQSAVSAVARGAAFADLMESFVKTGRANALPDLQEPCKFVPKTAGVAPMPRVAPKDPRDWTAEDARREAERCLLCSCRECVAVCDMLAYYGKDPKSAMLEAGNALGRGVLGGARIDGILSCMQCGLCKRHCPAKIDMGEIFLESRRALRRNGKLPGAHHEFWLNDMAFSCEEAAFTLLPEKNASPRLVFFPGCQAGAAEPGYVTAPWTRLQQAFRGDIALMSHCCGAPAVWAGDTALHEATIAPIRALHAARGAPVFVLACPQCAEMFREHLPEIETVFLWELPLWTDATPPSFTECAGSRVSVFDPCASHSYPALRSAVRDLLCGVGFEIEELPVSGADARCCGYGGLIGAAAPDLYESIGKKNAALGDLPFATYCVNCRDSLASHGKEAFHMFDLFFPVGRVSNDPPTLSARRENRMKVKAALTGEDIREEVMSDVKLCMSSDLLRELRKDLVLEEDVRAVIADAEKSGKRVLDGISGAYTAHLKIGYLTYWVRYMPVPDGAFRVLRVYKHRMTIGDEGA
jgi:Fe-S oxidoreductase